MADGPEQPQHQWKDGGLLLPPRLDAIEQEQALARQRDELAKQRDADYKERQLRLDRRLVFLNGGVLIVAAGALVISIWQAKIATHNADAAVSAANTAKQAQIDGAADSAKALAQMKTHADAAKVQAEASREMAAQLRDANRLTLDTIKGNLAAARREQRALLETPVLRLDAEPDSDPPEGRATVTVRYQIRNIGRIPAENVIIRDSGGLSRRLIPEPNWQTMGGPQPVVVYPLGRSEGVERTTIARNVPLVFPPGGVALYRAKGARIYWWTRIQYRDAFDSYELKICVSREFGDPLDHWQFCPSLAGGSAHP